MNVRICTLVFVALISGLGRAQQTSPAPPSPSLPKTNLDTPAAQSGGDRSTLASPVSGTTPAANANAPTRLDTPAAQESGGDASALASPVPPRLIGSTLRVGTQVDVTLTEDVSSGSQINGTKVRAKLAAPVRSSSGVVLPAGTAVEGTVVSSAKAGLIASGGVLSLQLTQVGGIATITDVRDFNGSEGHKDVADSAPEKGTEAMVARGTLLTFHVLEPGKATGLVPGVPPATNPGGNSGGGQNSGQGSGNNTPNTTPAIKQTPIGGATQGVVPQGSTPR